MASKKKSPFNLGGILNMAVYQKIRRLLKPRAMRPYHDTQSDIEKNSDAQSYLEQLLEQAITDKEGINLIYKEKLFIAAVPVEEVELIKQLETCLDANTSQVQKIKPINTI